MKIGIIGMGDMGKLFAKSWNLHSYDIHACDLPNNFEKLSEEFEKTNINIHKEPKSFVNNCDLILFCVEAENIASVVKKSASYINPNAIISGQTSVKTPEILAFLQYLPKSCQIVGSHALFGPQVDPKQQTMAIFNQTATTENYIIAKRIFSDIGANLVELENYQSHDKMMADIQVVTHVGFESIGTSFLHRGQNPWLEKSQISGLDNIKFLLTLRIFSYKAHVYAGLAFNNPYAIKDVRKYASIENELFGLMISEKRDKFISKVLKARDHVFKDHDKTLMLDDSIMKEYSLKPSATHKPNSHLSLLSMVCTWSDLNTNPYKNLICQTPPFKLRVGLAEYLFLNEEYLNETIETALKDKSILADDLAFHTAVHEWTNILELGDKNAYLKHFEKTKKYLEPQLEYGRAKSTELISLLNS